MKTIQISDTAHELISKNAAKKNMGVQEWIENAVGRVVTIDEVHEHAAIYGIPAADKSDGRRIHSVASNAVKGVSSIQQQLISELQKNIAKGLQENGLPVTDKTRGTSFEYIVAVQSALMFLQAEVYEYSLKSDFEIIKEYRGYP